MIEAFAQECDRGGSAEQNDAEVVDGHHTTAREVDFVVGLEKEIQGAEIDDAKAYAEVTGALDNLGVSADSQSELFTVLSALLLLGNTTMIQDDKIKAKSILKQIKGCKVADDNNNQYEVVDVKCFNGQVSFIGLKDSDGVVKYASENCYMSMADVA